MDLEYRNIPGVGQFYECPKTLLALEAWIASRGSVQYASLLAAAERYLDFRHTSDIGMGTQYSGVHPETELKNAIAMAKGEVKDGN